MTVDDVIDLYADEQEVRLFFVFTGTVQGVGFRWTTQDLARKARVSGWVRNMEDGTVEAEMQGSGVGICMVLEGLRKQYLDAVGKYSFLRSMGLHFEIDTCERRTPQVSDEGTDFKVTA